MSLRFDFNFSFGHFKGHHERYRNIFLQRRINAGKDNKHKPVEHKGEQDLVVYSQIPLASEIITISYQTNKVNGLIIEDNGCSWESCLTDDCVWFRQSWEPAWQHLIHSNKPYTDGGGNQFAWGCFHRLRCTSVIPRQVTFGTHVLFIPCEPVAAIILYE